MKKLLKALKRARKATQHTSRQAAVEAWVRDVTALYRQIEAWIRKAKIGEDLAAFSRQSAPLSEDRYGDYECDELHLLLAGVRVRFVPVGLEIIGCTGRVDVIHGPRKYLLLRDAGSKWTVLSSCDRFTPRRALTADVLEGVLLFMVEDRLEQLANNEEDR